MTRTRRGPAFVAVALLVAACTADKASVRPKPSPSLSSAATPTPVAPTPAEAPTVSTPAAARSSAHAEALLSRLPETVTARDVHGRAVPRPDRPTVRLTFDATEWRSGIVTGTELVSFRPDLKVCELVFRLWPNRPVTARAGVLLTISTATVGVVTDAKPSLAPVAVALEPAGGTADAPTLATLPLPTCAQPGDQVMASLDFRLQLGGEVSERVGYSKVREVAWFGTAFPVLAWEYGAGWMRDPAVDIYGDMQASEDFDLGLKVIAPANDIVQGEGKLQGVAAAPHGAKVHSYTARAMRDVGVAVGRFTTVVEDVHGVRVHVAVPAGSQATPQRWLADIKRALPVLQRSYGPFPYDDIWLTVVFSNLGSGFEYPGATVLPDIDPDSAKTVVTHELAHSYFWGLVGNNTARDPWLDEAFATYSTFLATGPDDTPPPHSSLPVGAPMSFWATQEEAGRVYFEHVYARGAFALWDARTAAGSAKFDAAIRRYLDERAHRIARPEDLVAALADLPKALAVLRTAGALSKG